MVLNRKILTVENCYNVKILQIMRHITVVGNSTANSQSSNLVKEQQILKKRMRIKVNFDALNKNIERCMRCQKHR